MHSNVVLTAKVGCVESAEEIYSFEAGNDKDGGRRNENCSYSKQRHISTSAIAASHRYDDGLQAQLLTVVVMAVLLR